MKIFLTQDQSGRRIGPRIEALDFGHAELLAEPLDVEVVGRHVLTMSGEDLTDDKVDKVCKASSESIKIE